jgi:hypothetical protein
MQITYQQASRQQKRASAQQRAKRSRKMDSESAVNTTARRGPGFGWGDASGAGQSEITAWEGDGQLRRLLFCGCDDVFSGLRAEGHRALRGRQACAAVHQCVGAAGALRGRQACAAVRQSVGAAGAARGRGGAWLILHCQRSLLCIDKVLSSQRRVCGGSSSA